jgi:hypothetical protein
MGSAEGAAANAAPEAQESERIPAAVAATTAALFIFVSLINKTYDEET